MVGAKWKYARTVEVLEDCPPKTLKSRQGTAYRIVHKDLGHKNNFLPTALIPNARPPGVSECCSDYAISFFENLEKAVARFLELHNRNQMFGKRAGTCIAEVTITEKHGAASHPNKKTSHFDLHEYDGADFLGHAKIVRPDLDK